VREKIIKILGRIKFDSHFDSSYSALKDSQKQELFDWITLSATPNAIVSYSKGSTLAFVHRFGSNIRAVLTKEKNGFLYIPGQA
jgi:hypothetical protein